MIRILLADDLTIIRKGVRYILTQAYPNAVIEEIEEGDMQKLREGLWDIMIFGLPGRGKGGWAALQRMRKEYPRLPILILGFSMQEDGVLRAVQSGAAGYLSKDAVPEELVWAVREILAGKKCVAIPSGQN